MNSINLFLAMLCSYLLGSIPTAYWFGKMKGIDIRKHGSGNVGATNAFRVLGKGPGTLVLIFDILKGALAITLIGDLFYLSGIGPRVLLALAVVSGHNWPVFLKFKGGKGIATSLGVLIGLSIKFALGWVLLYTVLIFLFTFLLTGYVSLGSILAAIALPLIMIATDQSFEIIVLGVIFCIFVVIRHKSNIKRLLNGSESRVKIFGKNKPK